MIGVVGRRQPSNVSNVFSQFLRAIEVQAGESLIRVVLVDQCLPGSLEMSKIGGGPPVAKAAVSVERCAQIVEAVANLVPNNRSNRTIFGGSVGIRVIEALFEDRCREVQSILQRQIHRVYGLGRHPPFAFVNRLTNLANLMFIIGDAGAIEVTKGVARADFKA